MAVGTLLFLGLGLFFFFVNGRGPHLAGRGAAASAAEGPVIGVFPVRVAR
jgi:hypothetical protein